jgi:uncharacterized membrane protein
MHSLKLISLLSWAILITLQMALPWMMQPEGNLWLLLLVLPLLIPLKGLLSNQRYTYKWTGFLTLLYFCIGISELFSNPQLRSYGIGTSVASMLLFLASIYYARYLGLQRRD